MKFNPAIAGLLSSLSVRGPTKAHEPKRSEALDSALGNAFGYFPCLQLYFNFNYLFSVTSCILVYFLSCPVLFRLFSCPPLQNAEDSHNPTSQPHLTTYLGTSQPHFTTPLVNSTHVTAQEIRCTSATIPLWLASNGHLKPGKRPKSASESLPRTPLLGGWASMTNPPPINTAGASAVRKVPSAQGGDKPTRFNIHALDAFKYHCAWDVI